MQSRREQIIFFSGHILFFFRLGPAGLSRCEHRMRGHEFGTGLSYNPQVIQNVFSSAFSYVHFHEFGTGIYYNPQVIQNVFSIQFVLYRMCCL